MRCCYLSLAIVLANSRGITAQAGRVPDKISPTVPVSFALNFETVSPNEKEVFYEKIHFDYENKLVKLESSAHPGAASPNSIRRVYDYNTGLTYETDKVTGFCTVGVIDESGRFNRPDTGGQLVMMSGREYLDVTGLKAAKYNGTAVIRGVDVDLWVSTYYNSFQKSYVRETFAFTSGWNIGGLMGSSATQYWYSEMVFLDQSGKIFKAQVSHLDDSEMDLTAYDYDNCYPPDQKRFFIMELYVGDQKDQVEALGQRQLVSELQRQVANKDTLHFLRIASPKVHQKLGDDYMYFSAWLLGQTPYVNSRVQPPLINMDIFDAIGTVQVREGGENMLIRGDGGTMVLLEARSLQVLEMKPTPPATPAIPTPLPTTSVAPTPAPLRADSQGVSAGAVAGAAVGCALGGLLLGALLVLVLVSRRTKQSLSVSLALHVFGRSPAEDASISNPAFK